MASPLDTERAFDASDRDRTAQMIADLSRRLGAARAKRKRPWWHWVLMVPLACVLLAAVFLLNAWAAAWLWYWFVVPLGMPMLGMAHALGLGILATFFASDRTAIAGLTRDESEKGKLRVLLSPFMTPTVTVVAGYVVHRIMVS